MCPSLGKGFKGTCYTCGTPGHSGKFCPKGNGKGVREVTDPGQDQSNAEEGLQEVHLRTPEELGWGPVQSGYGYVEGIEAAHESFMRKLKEFRRTKELEEKRNQKEHVEVNQVEEEKKWRRKVNGKWVIDIVLDSGAVTTEVPTDTIPGMRPKPTEASRRGICYTAADGGSIPNEGELLIQGTAGGRNIKVTAQACPVTRPLGSVREIVEAGNEVILRKGGGAIVSHKTGTQTPLAVKNGSWVVEVAVAPTASPVETRNRWSCLAMNDEEQEAGFHRQEDLI